MAMLCRDVLYIAFREAHILKRPQGFNAPSELQDGLIFLNQQINYWAARNCYAYTTNFAVYAFVPGHHPYLIGPNVSPPDFVTPIRPTSLQSASVILAGQGGTTPVDLPINIRDNAWWANNQIKNLQSTLPTDVYYETDYPNGQLYFWPVPNQANGVRLESTVQLQQFNTLDDPFIAPQAYLAAVTLTLAEELVDLWEVPMPVNLARRAIKARDALQSNNNLAPRIASADWGTFATPAGDFNYMTGTIPD